MPRKRTITDAQLPLMRDYLRQHGTEPLAGNASAATVLAWVELNGISAATYEAAKNYARVNIHRKRTPPKPTTPKPAVKRGSKATPSRVAKTEAISVRFELELQRLNERERKKVLKGIDELAREIRREAVWDVEEERSAIRRAQTDDFVEQQKEWAKIRAHEKIARSPFTKSQFKSIRGLLHPDVHPGKEDRAKRAFDVFNQIEKICRRTK